MSILSVRSRKATREITSTFGRSKSNCNLDAFVHPKPARLDVLVSFIVELLESVGKGGLNNALMGWEIAVSIG